MSYDTCSNCGAEITDRCRLDECECCGLEGCTHCIYRGICEGCYEAAQGDPDDNDEPLK